MTSKSKIIRRPDFAGGGITEGERAAMAEHAKLWIARAMRTDPIELDKITTAIESLYAAAGCAKPIVVIVPSPFVMAFAYGFAAAIWYLRQAEHATDEATRLATDEATWLVTDEATRLVTDEATDGAIWQATAEATWRVTDGATEWATRLATDEATRLVRFFLMCAARWTTVYQGGNMWAGYDCYLTAARDILGLRLPSHAGYAAWEQAAIHGGFRCLHEKFCIVSDFPEVLRIDDRNLPHCETGPSHRWRDGWALYHWHGVAVPAAWIEEKDSLTPAAALAEENTERRRAACEIIGWDRILRELKAKTIDRDADPQIGELVEVRLPDAGKQRFLRVHCGTGRQFAIPVPPTVHTALEAQAWTWDIDPASFTRPEFRT